MRVSPDHHTIREIRPARGLTLMNLASPKENKMIKQFKTVVEKHSDGYVANPLNLKGVVVGQGESYEEALTDVRSAITFHIETFGSEVLATASGPSSSAMNIRWPGK